jgi:hypothetical protein
VATFHHERGLTVVQVGSLTEAGRLLEGVDFTILDLSLLTAAGADLIPQLHAADPHATAVVLTSSLDPARRPRRSNVARQPCSISLITYPNSWRRSNASSDGDQLSSTPTALTAATKPLHPPMPEALLEPDALKGARPVLR